AQLSLQVTYIILLTISRIVNEKGECRGAAPGLGRVVELQVAAAGSGRRGHATEDLVNGPIELRGRDRARVFLVDLGARRQDPRDALPGFGGDVEARHEAKERILTGELLVDQLADPDRIVDQVPLVEDHDDSLPLVLGERREVRVLARRLAGDVDHEDDEVGPGDRAKRARDAVVLDRVGDLSVPPEAGRVY